MLTFNPNENRFYARHNEWLFIVDLKSCYIGTLTNGIYFEYNSFPVIPIFLVTPKCGLDYSFLEENGITFVYKGGVRSINQNIIFHGVGEYWENDGYFYGIFSRGRKVFGIWRNYSRTFIGYYNENSLSPGLMLRCSGLHTGNNSIRTFHNISIMWGFFDQSHKLIHGRFYSIEEQAVRVIPMRDGRRHGLFTLVKPTRLYRCWYVKGIREGGFVDYGRSTIYGNYRKGRLRGNMTVHNNAWKKTLTYTRKGCVKGKIYFPENRKILLHLVDGVEKIDSVVVNNKFYKNPIDIIENVPLAYRCPISLMCMTNPVTSSLKRHHYDHGCLKKWFVKRKREPLTNERLKSRKIIFDYELRDEIYCFIFSYFEHKNLDQKGLT